MKNLSFIVLLVLGSLVPAYDCAAQTQFNNPLAISKGQGIIDGKNSTSYFYLYEGKDSVWAASYANIADKEVVMINYKKTTTSDCVVTFPVGSVIAQASNMPGVIFSGFKFTLKSSEKGAFQILINRDGSNYNVQITRLVP